jgi:hypothetical protein
MTSVLPNASTFEVHDVACATKPLDEIPYRDAVESLLETKVEACSSYRGMLVKPFALIESFFNPLIDVLFRAYCYHHPVVITPDVIWLTITQGLALHITENAEELRHHFVQHEGQETIQVRRDDFIKGSPANPWREVFSEFSSAVRERIGENHDLIVANFSTTGPEERAASEIVLLASMQRYFKYEFVTLCGIPSITLLGTVEDWESIATRVNAFRRFGLDWWIDPLEPILAQFAEAKRGSVNQEFWQSIYRWHHHGSHNPYVTGWVTNLFPYLVANDGLHQNRFVIDKLDKGPEPDEFPSQPARTPFVWKVFNREFDMEFIGGLIGVRQDPDTLALTPEIGWAVRDVTQAAEQSMLA